MTHLGTQLSALADGQLGTAAADRAMAHVAACHECADGLAAARAARSVLAGAFAVEPTADLTARLLALGAQQQGLRPSGTSAGNHRDPAAHWVGSRRVPLPGDRGGLPSGGLRGDVSPRRVPVAALAAGLLGVGLVSVLFVLGGEPVTSPGHPPAQALGLLSRAADALEGTPPTVVVVDEVADSSVGSTPAVSLDPAASAWALPVAVPEGFRVAAVRSVDGPTPSFEVDLVGPHGLVVVTQTLARLDETALEGIPMEVGDRTVLVLSGAPWQVVWQSGDVMVEVVAEVPSAVVSDLVAAAPVRAYDAGAPARLVRGWHNVTLSWSSP